MIERKTEREIKNIVNDLLKKHNILTPPVLLDTILEKENIKYLEKDLKVLNLSDDIDALIYKDDEMKVLAVNPVTHLYPAKKRFSIAHELGHLFLHFTDNQKHYIAFRNYLGTEGKQEEIEANIFASNLLMPDEMVEKEYFELELPAISLLAQKFKVSHQAMKIKLNNLHLGYIDV